MSDRAKEIAEKIINEVWPELQADKIMLSVFEAAVEKHMPKLPYQVRDISGRMWGQASNGRYSQSHCACGFTLAGLEKRYGPLTEVQGDPLPDVAALKAQIAEIEEAYNVIVVTASEESERQAARIAELEKQISKLKMVGVGAIEAAEKAMGVV